MIKFKHAHLIGYGFDVAADRVVRFSKHPEGTYMNTRATYELNGHSYTHYRLREIALERELVSLPRQGSPISKRVWFIAAALLIIVALTECSITMNVDIDQQTTSEGSHG